MNDRRLRNKLVASLREGGWLHDDRVAAAFATVPRHLFVPDQPARDVYTNRAFVTKTLNGMPVSSSSEPSIMAVMLEMLDVPPGARVLEIGAGTGYNAGLLAHLTGPRGAVTAVELDADTAKAARKHLRSAGAKVRVVAADGALGYDARAPYDRVIATAGCWQIPEAWVDQLVDGGVIVLPLRLNAVHVCLALRKRGRELHSVGASPCGFMPMRGPSGQQHDTIIVDGTIAASEVELSATTRRRLERTLTLPRSVRVRFPRLRDAQNWPLHYLALQGKPMLNVFYASDVTGAQPFGLMASRRSVITLPWSGPAPRQLTLFGNDAALDYLPRMLARWKSDGRPDLRHLRVRISPTSRKLGPRPRRSGERYRFRRGAQEYEMWFEMLAKASLTW